MFRILKGTLIVMALASYSAAASAEQPSDAWITTKLKVALLTEDHVDALSLDVDTFDGVVTIHGPVEADATKQRVAEVARSIDGVRDVRNLVAIVPTSRAKQVDRSDEELEQQIDTVLSRDKALEGSAISIDSVTDGIVVLTGRAESLSAHKRALEDVRSVDGVTRVASQIESPDRLADEEIWWDADRAAIPDRAANAASDMWITTRSKARLMSSAGLSPLAINVDTRDGIVTLFGTVATKAMKEKAEREIARIDGVREIENELQIVPNVAAKRVEKADDRILEAVEARLEAKSELDDAEVDVAVENAVVRLTGTVASQADRMRALATARTTDGVDSVIDDLRLRHKS